MTPELSLFSDSNICWDKIRLGESEVMKIEVTSSELEEELFENVVHSRLDKVKIRVLKSDGLNWYHLLRDYQIVSIIGKAEVKLN